MWQPKIKNLFKQLIFGAVIKLFVVFVLIFSWVFSGWPLALVLATATSSPTATAAITVPEQADEESAPEEVAPPQEPAPPPRPPLKERTLRREVRVAHQAAHRCDAETFRIDISGRTSAEARIRLGGKKVQTGEVEIGSLPLGIDVLFLKNGDYLERVSQNDGAFDLEIVSQEGSQKGSFSVPILYRDAENNQITVCQINIVNF